MESTDAPSYALTRKDAEIARYRDALRPFVELAKKLPSGFPDDAAHMSLMPLAGDFRRAVAAME